MRRRRRNRHYQRRIKSRSSKTDAQDKTGTVFEQNLRAKDLQQMAHHQHNLISHSGKDFIKIFFL